VRRSLVPHTKMDRFTAIGMVVFAIIGIAQFATNQPPWQIALSTVAVLLSVLNAYVLQDQSAQDRGSAEYTRIIARLVKTTEDFKFLQAFLEQERERVIEAEATLSSLRAEKARLEPLVKTDSQTIEAVLEAYAQGPRARFGRNASSALL
jgi:hypothetical protein